MGQMYHYLLIVVFMILSLSVFSQTKRGTITIKANQKARIDNGKNLYVDNCAMCHSQGSARIVGAGLMGMTKKYELSWLYKYITNYLLLVKCGDSLALEVEKRKRSEMSLFPSLTFKEVEDIYLYVDDFNKRNTKND